MGRGNIITVNPEKIALTDTVRTGRKRVMSFFNLNLNISHFHIDIRVKRDDEKRKEKIRKLIEHDKRIKDVMEERNKLDTQFMRINI
jgi:hypothetical protein